MSDADQQQCASREEQQCAFRETEYKEIIALYKDRIDEAISVLKYTLVASAAIVTWLTTGSAVAAPHLKALAWSIPLGLSIFGLARDCGIRVQLNSLESYLKQLEGKLGSEKGGYFKHNADQIKQEKQKHWWIQFTDIRYFYFSTILAFLIMVLVESLS